MFDVSLSECKQIITLVLLSFPLKDSRAEFWQILNVHHYIMNIYNFLLVYYHFLIVLGC